MSNDGKIIYTNLRVLKKARKRPADGDIFTFQLPDDRYYFGRVVGADLPRTSAPFAGSNLVYIYNVGSGQPSPVLDELVPSNLLIPPTFTNRKSWTLGYFLNVANRPIQSDDLLPQECFYFRDGRYVDRQRRNLPEEVAPCGEWAMTSYRMLDDLISGALGFMPAPASPGDKEHLG